MRAIDARIVRQSGQPLQIGEHLRRRPFEQPAATHGEQRVADKSDPLVGQVIGDMPRRMRGHRHHLRDMVADANAVAFADRPVERADPLRFRGRTGNDAAGGRLDRRIAAGMVAMPMRVPDLVDPPPARRRRFKHRVGHRRVDRHRLATGGVMHQPDIVVG